METAAAVSGFAPVEAERPLFRSFFQGGFECSTHRRRDGRRLDVIAAVGHDRHALQDYRQLAGLGLRTIRDGFRWHLIEPSPGRYDWSSIVPMLRAARLANVQVIWDLLHYGWPDDIDIWRPDFVKRFALFAGEAARIVRSESDAVPFYAPINEISFLSWAGGDAGYLNPFANGRGFELKVQLVRAAIAAMDAILDADPRARFIHCDPAINIVADPLTPTTWNDAVGHHQSQFQAWDMLSGRMWPQLGGAPRYLDIVGVNYYANNQWIHGGPPIDRHHPLYRPFRHLAADIYGRYQRPMFVAETGIEGDHRAPWLDYMAAEVHAAMDSGVPMEGICLYPVVDHPGWDDDRACPNGLLGAVPWAGDRTIHAPLADSLLRSGAVPPYHHKAETVL